MELIQILRDGLSDRYDVERELGGGGMSRVFVATERSLSRRVVIKVLMPELAESVNVERFRLEIATSAKLQHPQIIPVFGTGTCGDLLYYVMPFVAGETLRARLESAGAMPPAEVTRILTLLARGLAYAHREGVVHRDIKPENILLAQGEPLLADFGIAKVLRQGGSATGLTSTGMSIGTVTYMAPEQVVADPGIDGRADVYSLAALGFELLAGAPPFTGSSQQVMSAHVVTPAPSIVSRVPGCPPSLASAIMQGLAKDVADRPDADAFAALLAVRDAAPAPVSSIPRSNGRVIALAAAGVVAAIAAGAFLLDARTGAMAGVTSPAASKAQPGLGVLPFQNIGGSGDDAYFAAGLTAELTTAIGKVPGLRIASQSTVRAYADSGLAPSDLARRLGVSALVEGSAQRAGDRLRVTARLVDASDGHTLWSERYDRTVEDVFATQSEISNAIVSALAPRFGTAATTTQVGAGTADLDAYDSFLRGRFAQDARDLPAALALYRKALQRDSVFARAWAGVAEVLAFMPVYGQGTYTVLAPDIRTAAVTAIRIDSTLAEPHTALGLLAKGTAEWAVAERELRAAAELQPRNGTARQILAELLFTLGRLDEAERELRRAAELEPMNGVIVGEYAYTQLLVGQLASARATIARALGLDSRNPFIHYTKGVIDERAGDYRSAVASMEVAAERAPQPFFVGVLARTYRLAGDTAAARRTSAKLQAMAAEPGTSLARAIDMMDAAPPDAVLSLMETAVRDKDPFMYLLPMRTWLFDPVRSDPRFARIVASLGLPPLAATAMPAVTR